jgi:hypothetical protein
MLMYLWDHCPQTVLALIPLIPEYGYWKDLTLLIAEVQQEMSSQANKQYLPLQEQCYRVMADQLKEDLATYEKWKAKGFPEEDKPKLSLCAKYAPKEGRSFDKQHKCTKRLAKLMYPETFASDFKTALRRFRKEVGNLNRAIKTTETLMSSGQWDEIEFYLVPGKCLSTCRRAFLNLKGKRGNDLRHPDDQTRNTCRSNLQRHMERAAQGKTKLNAGGLFLHEIIGKMVSGYQIIPMAHEQYGSNGLDADELKILQIQWDTLVAKYRQMFTDLGLEMDKTVVLADMSGSMSGDPILVSLTMSILLSELAPEAYGNRFLSFDTVPRWIEFQKGMTLYEKVRHALASPWGGSTDFIKAHELMIATCVQHKLKQDQVPKAMIVISDMQWNAAKLGNGYGNYSTLQQWADTTILESVKQSGSVQLQYAYGYHGNLASRSHPWETHHEILKKAWATAGVTTTGTAWEMPQQIYWNVRGDTVGFPAQADTPNTQMISGFSADLLKLVLENRTQDYKEKPPPTPWDTFCKAVDDERYDPVCKVIEQTQERGVFAHYRAPKRSSDGDTSDVEDESKHSVGSGSTGSADETWDTCGDVVSTSPSKTSWTAQEVSKWLQKLGYPEATTDAVIEEGVDGAVLDSVVADQDRQSLQELFVTKRLAQTRIFTEWAKI